MVQFLIHLPTWNMVRLFGMISYLLLFAGISLGMIYGFPGWKGRTKARLFKIHTFCTNSGTLFALLHAIVLVIDTFMPFTWKEILIPFHAANSPFLNGIGTLAAYGMLLLIFTSDIRNKLKKAVWFRIHLLSYPIFILALIHGLFLGTDSSDSNVRYMYLFTFLFVLLLVILRSINRAFASEGQTAAPANRSSSRNSTAVQRKR